MHSAPKDPGKEKVKNSVIKAICELYIKDTVLLDINANERSITHKLAEYLQMKFPEWHVDCEYNRYYVKTKLLNIMKEKKEKHIIKEKADPTIAITVYPDILVHRRMTQRNLIVMEVKKAASTVPDQYDTDKLKMFTKSHAYKYQYGLFLRIGFSSSRTQHDDNWMLVPVAPPVNSDYSDRTKKLYVKLLYFAHGEEKESWSKDLAHAIQEMDPQNVS